MNLKTLKKILKIRFLLSKKSQKTFLGFYKSAFKGSGLAFKDFREYTAGDDIRSICWPLTAKMGKPFIKTFEEDRGNTFVLMVDVSASSYFGGQQIKKDVIHQMSALIALLAEKNQDQVSLLLFSDHVEHYVPPKKGPNHVMRIIQDVDQARPSCSQKTSFKQACLHLRNILKKRCYIFVLSDFFADDFESSLRLLKQKHHLTAVIAQDPLEKQFPKLGFVELEDMEKNHLLTVDSSSRFFQKQYMQSIEEMEQKRESKLKKCNIDYFYIQTGGDIFKPFIQFIQKKKYGVFK